MCVCVCSFCVRGYIIEVGCLKAGSVLRDSTNVFYKFVVAVTFNYQGCRTMVLMFSTLLYGNYFDGLT